MRFDRHRRSRLARLGAVIAAVVASGVAATPAHADPTFPPFVSAFLDDVIIGGNGATGKAVPFFVDGNRATAPKVTVDFSGLAGIASMKFPDGCKTAGTTATCTLPDGVEDFNEVLPLVFQPVAGVADGAKGTITYHASASNVDPQEEQTATVTVKDGIDLVVTSGAGTIKAKPDDHVAVPIAFSNTGNRDAAGATVTLLFSHGVLPDAYTNCLYGDVPDLAGTFAVCTINNPIAAGQSYEVPDGGFGTVIAKDGLGLETVDEFVDPISAATAALGKVKLHTKGGTSKLTLVATKKPAQKADSGDIDNRDNYALQMLNVANGFDVAAIGADATGAVGDKVKVKIGVKNVGAGALDSFRSGEPVMRFQFTVPAGAETVTVPGNCDAVIWDPDGTTHLEKGKPGESYYMCAVPRLFMGSGESFMLEFGLKIKSLDGAAGAVSLDNKIAVPTAFKDDNNANNTAAVTVTSPGGSGGGLPVTGVQVGAIAGGGAALLAAGGVLLLLARRRRVTLVAGVDEQPLG